MMNSSSLQLATAAFGIAALMSGCATNHPASKTLAPMPEAVTSFGAATSDGWLYVFGGHKGERHEYSAEMVSGSFHRLNLNDGRAWEQLPAAAPGQGQPLVAHGGYVYRVGGMAARNHEGEKQNLFSTDLVQRFNPRARQWENLPPLPTPRSSHDAVMVGDKLYIVGGWRVSGGTREAVWPTNGLVLDLATPETGWKDIPQPFQRRALALAALGSRIYCIGGMDSNNKPTLAVEVFDTATGQWSKGPDLPPGEHKGFSCSAIAQGGRVYAAAFQGDLLRLATDEKFWEIVGRLEHPRMAHRLVTAGATQLIALGGEDGEEKRPDLELLSPATKPLFATKPTGSASASAAASSLP